MPQCSLTRSRPDTPAQFKEYWRIIQRQFSHLLPKASLYSSLKRSVRQGSCSDGRVAGRGSYSWQFWEVNAKAGPKIRKCTFWVDWHGKVNQPSPEYLTICWWIQQWDSIFHIRSLSTTLPVPSLLIRREGRNFPVWCSSYLKLRIKSTQFLFRYHSLGIRHLTPL